MYLFNPVKVGDVFSSLHYIPMFNDCKNLHKNTPGPLIILVPTENSLQCEKLLRFLVNFLVLSLHKIPSMNHHWSFMNTAEGKTLIIMGNKMPVEFL